MARILDITRVATLRSGEKLETDHAIDGSGVLDASVLVTLFEEPLHQQGLVDLRLRKLDSTTPAFIKTGAGSISIKAGTQVYVAGRLITFAADTAATIDTSALAVGTDYALYVTGGGLIVFSANFSSPAGYTPASALQIGGFHYGPGGPAAAQAGGDSTPQIFEPSIWDLKFRPTCADPRAKAYCPGVGWVCLYPLNTTPHLLGASAYGAQIADGTSLPIIPTERGGNGSDLYPDFSRFIAEELLGVHGLDLLTPAQRSLAAYGVTEGTGRGTDPVTTGLDAPRTSRFMFQATGNMWELLAGETINAITTFAWRATPQSRGQIYHTALMAPLGGGHWADGADCGSRCSDWSNSPWVSYSYVGARGRCDHLSLV